MLFEKYVRGDLETLIKTSQMRADDDPAYPELFEDLFQKILENPNLVHKQPLFHWGGVWSTNWRLERSRAWQMKVDRILRECEEYEGKEKYKRLKSAEEAAGICMHNILEWKYRLESTRVTPLHLRYTLAQLLRIRALRLHTAYLCVKDSENIKMRKAGALHSFQNYELSHQLWRPQSDPILLNSLRETAHFEMAQEGDFQNQLNHAVQCPSYEDFHASILQKNEVWKLEPEPSNLPLWSMQEFVSIYQKEISKE